MKRTKSTVSTMLPIVLMMAVSVCLMGGCSLEQGIPLSKKNTTSENEASAEETVSANEEKSKNTGNLLVNQIGYESSARKLVIIRNQQSDQVFEVVDADSGLVKLTGIILENEYNEKSDEYTAYGDFSKLKDEGSYYIKVGNTISDTFAISETVYQEMEKTQKQFLQAEQTQIDQADRALIIADDVLTYTYYAELQNAATERAETDNESKEEKIPQILQMAREETEHILKESKLSLTSIAALTMFAGEYQSFDADYSKECLNTAIAGFAEQKEQAEQSIQADSSELTDDLYWAAAELYKTTGDKTYQSVLNTIFEGDIPKGFGKGAVGYYGTLAYLTTTYKTDVDICTELMEQLFDDAIAIIEDSSKDGYKVSAKDAYPKENSTQMLQNARLLTLMNIISKSTDYVLGVENHLDYLCGRNPYQINYFSKEHNMYQEESFLFVLSGLMYSYENGGEI